MAGIDSNRVIALVVWFHPSEKEVEALKLYADALPCTLVVDNSGQNNESLLVGLNRVQYIYIGENKGIATALNVGCRRAVELGAEWVLTMDQDSLWKLQSVTEYIAEANQCPIMEKVAIFSPLHVCHNGHHHSHTQRFEPRSKLMCSGNLLRLDAWKQVGGFRDDFFIDYVDTEICYHLRQKGWKIIRTNHIQLLHFLGDASVYVGKGKKRKGYSLHPAWRYFYMGRNCRKMMRLYPLQFFSLATDFLRELRHVWRYDDSEKRSEKLHNYFKGWSAGRQPG